MKKLLSTIMALVMLLSLVPMAVAAEGVTEENAVARIGNQYYETLEDAVLKVANGDTITLLKDVALGKGLNIGSVGSEQKVLTLNLNGHSISATNLVIRVQNAKLTVTGPGKIYETSPYFGAILIKGSDNAENKDYTVVTVGAGVELEGWSPIFVDQYNGCAYGVAVNVDGAKLTGKTDKDGGSGSAIYVNGTIKDQNNAPKLVLNNVTQTATGAGMYLAGYANTTITGGSITGGNTGIEIRAGELTLNDCALEATAEEFSCEPNGNGATTAGAAIAIAQHTTKKDIAVTINGGSFKGVKALNESNPQVNDPAPQVKLSIDGGTFIGDISTADVTGFIKGGTFTDLASAVKYATNGATITLAGDTNGNGVVFAEGRFATKGLTIDFNGHTYSVGGVLVGSTGTGTNAFQLLKGNKITFKNGTIAGVTEGTKPAEDTPNWHGAPAIVIQNYCDLTLDNMTVTGGDETVYTMSNNNGNVTIKDTTINKGGAKGYTSGPVAFDVCRYASYPAVSVTVTGDSVINGNVEVSGTIGEGQSRQLTINSGMFNGKFVVANEPANITISGGAFNVAPDAKYLAEGMIVVPGVKDAPYSVQPAKREDENIKSEVKVDGDNVTVTVTDKTTGTTTETVTDTKTGAKTETKTETKVEGNVTTKTETVTEKNAADETTKVTESKIVENNENGKTETKTTVDGKTVKTDVTVNQAPATASDVTLNAKALEGKAAGTETSSVTVDRASLSELKNDTVKDVIIETDQATLKLDKTAVKTMESKVEGNDKMTLDITVTEEKNATTTEIEKVKVEVNAKNEAGQNVFPKDTENTNGKITITIPYNGNAKYLDLWYIAANDSATYMGRFPVVNGFVSFDVKHFSRYDLLPVASSGSSVIKTGAGSSAASTTQTVTTDLTPGSITKVTVDGKVVDAKYYTVSGSNVTFTAEFLKTLKNGSHTVTVENATKIAKGVFTVNNPTTAQSPTTADAGIALYAGMAIASVMGTGVVFTSRKRKNH